MGSLQFATKVILPGRSFLRYLYVFFLSSAIIETPEGTTKQALATVNAAIKLSAP